MAATMMKTERTPAGERITWRCAGRDFVTEIDGEGTVRLFDDAGRFVTQCTGSPPHAWVARVLIAAHATSGN